MMSLRLKGCEQEKKTCKTNRNNLCPLTFKIAVLTNRNFSKLMLIYATNWVKLNPEVLGKGLLTTVILLTPDCERQGCPPAQVHWDLQCRVCSGVIYLQQRFPRGRRGGSAGGGRDRTPPVPRLPPFKLFHRKLSTGPGWRSGLFKKSFKFQRTI